MYPTELHINKANSFNTEAPFLDLDLSWRMAKFDLKFMINGMILIKKKLITRFLMEIFHSPIGVGYVSQLIRFANVCSECQ